MTDDMTSVPNADLLNTLTVVLENLEKNRQQVSAHGEGLRLQLTQNTETLKQFDAMSHALHLLVADPFALQQVAARLLADEVAAATPAPVEVPNDPLTNAEGTEGGDSSAAPASPTSNGQ